MPLGKGNPEVFKASDVWSFGVVMWEMWTGDVPYGAYGTVSNLVLTHLDMFATTQL
jgi:serine/threonine protein kinase